jgi:guanosine-3',5'-bis(diphosphate) 3'-pyrophosphohydrolase
MSGMSNKYWENEIQASFYRLIEEIKDDPSIDVILIAKAFDMANKAHRGQLRASNEPYIIHPLEVAKLVADLKMDTHTIITALLHDTIEDTALTYEKIRDTFGEVVTGMVKGVIKLNTIEAKNNITSYQIKMIENYRNLMWSVSKDIRVLVVKIADRVHNMRTLYHIPNEDKRRRIALETMDIHSALAERIGIHNFKNELQDLAFAQLYPQEKRSIEQQLAKLREGDKNLVSNIIKELQKTILQANVGSVQIFGREKTVCSIWRKLQDKKLSFENLSDIFAFRVITPDIPSCYNVLGAIHSNYKMVAGGFKDYISTPKENGYKSLHTVIIAPGNRKIELQIRTESMSEIAEFGVAAHWKYKQVLLNDRPEKNAWIDEMLEIFDSSTGEAEILANTKLGMHHHQVFCFTPKGDLIALPISATVLDFAFHVSSNLGLRCAGAKVNDEAVPFAHKLENGDQVEIMCAETNRACESWESILRTGKARNELKKYLNAEKRNKLVEKGQYNYQKYLDSVNIEYDEEVIKFPLKGVRQCNNINDLFYLIGADKLKVDKAVDIIYPNYKKRGIVFHTLFLIKKFLNLWLKRKVSQISLTKSSKTIFNFPKCCFPIKGDEALCFLDDKGNYYFHRTQCAKLNLTHEKSNKAMAFNWSEIKDITTYKSEIVVLISNKVGSLKTVIDLITSFRINIFNITSTNKFESFFECSIIIEVKDLDSLTQLSKKLKSLRTLYSIVRHIE